MSPDLSRAARGRWAEDLVARWYEARGYAIVARNWRLGTTAWAHGEIDLVALRPEVIVFCEVKARASSTFGDPALAVGRDKQERLRRLAQAYLSSEGVHALEVRFDVACVLGTRLQVIESAF